MELHGVPEEVLGAAVDEHIADPDDAHHASAIGVTPFGDIEATDVQAALQEIVSEIDTGPGADDRWEDIGDPPVAIGATRPVVLNDHPLYLRTPIADVPDLNHSIEWGYDRHEVDGALITGFTEVGVSVGDANEAEDELVGRFGQFWSWLKGRLLIAVDPGDDDGVYEVQIGGESSLRVEGEVKLEDVAAPESETYMVTVDEEGVLSSEEIPDGGGPGGSALQEYEARSSDTTLVAADLGKTIVATAGFTQTFDDAASLGDGWWCIFRNGTMDGNPSNAVVLDPDSTEQIDGIASLTIYSGDTRRIYSDGSALHTILIAGGYVDFPSSQNWIRPSRLGRATFDVVAGGGGGGGARGAAAGGVRNGGGGGGGGSRHKVTLPAAVLGLAGDLYAVTVGAGGGGGAGGSSNNGSDGSVGGTSSVGSLVSAYGGGGGKGGENGGSNPSGGAGGGVGEAGGTAATTAAVARGGGNATPVTTSGPTVWGVGFGVGTAGAGHPGNNNPFLPYPADWGGACGAHSWGNGGGGNSNAGGGSIHGGSGGGGGGSLNTGNTERQGGSGGVSGTYVPGTAQGGGGTTGGGVGPAGTAGNAVVSGGGGGGGGSNASGTGGAGGVGGVAGGGGGGGGAGTTVGGAGGNGGAGRVRISYEP